MSKPLEVPTMDMENKEVLRRIEITGSGSVRQRVRADGAVSRKAPVSVSGSGTLLLNNDKLTVHLSVTGLETGQSHEVSIRGTPSGNSTYNGYMPYTDRVDYIAAMFANQGWAMAVERLLGMQIPRRAEFCRVIACELNRISSHLISVGTMAMDIGAVTPFPYALREREFINDLLEELCGARLTYNYLRIGGVAFDLPSGYEDKVSAFLDHFEKILDEFNRLITYNEIFIKRLAHLAPIPAQMAIDYCLVGPNLRASGVNFDVRKALPYSVYPDFQFDVPLGKGEVGTPGDSWDRFWCRVEEMRQSCRILRQALAQLPKDAAIMAKVPRKIKIPEGTEAYSRIESARGDMQYYVVAGPGENAHRVKIRTGSFTAMGIIDELSRGLMIADLVALIASLDVVAPEIDR